MSRKVRAVTGCVRHTDPATDDADCEKTSQRSNPKSASKKNSTSVASPRIRTTSPRVVTTAPTQFATLRNGRNARAAPQRKKAAPAFGLIGAVSGRIDLKVSIWNHQPMRIVRPTAATIAPVTKVATRINGRRGEELARDVRSVTVLVVTALTGVLIGDFFVLGLCRPLFPWLD
jgi:hypothetical protein